MKIYCTTCCKEKETAEEEMPAIVRYISPRINMIYEKSLDDEVEFRILSGKFGLLKPGDEICWYDQKLEMPDVEERKQMVKEQLTAQEIRSVVFFGKEAPDWQPYTLVIRDACAELNIPFETEFVSENLS